MIPSGALAAAWIRFCIGAVNSLKPIASSSSSRASAPSSGWKLEMKEPGCRDIRFGLAVVAAMDRVVRPLEQAALAVQQVLLRQARRLCPQRAGRGDDTGGDVVLGLHLAAG
jgi:hypothetical protein